MIVTFYRKIRKTTFDMRVFRSCAVEGPVFLGCDSESRGNRLQTFRGHYFRIRLPLTERRGLENMNPLHLVVTGT